jgi:hypothetical protein
VEPAFLPEKPFRPDRLAIMFIGAVFGVGFSIGLAALKETSDRSIHDSVTAERLSGLPVISKISRIVTLEDAIRSRRRKLAAGTAGVCGIIAILLVFHLFVMDFDIFYAKVERLVQRKTP